MALYKFRIRLFDSWTGEEFCEMETKPLPIHTPYLPDDNHPLFQYLRAYVRRLANNPDCEFGLIISSEKMLNRVKVQGHYHEGKLL